MFLFQRIMLEKLAIMSLVVLWLTDSDKEHKLVASDFQKSKPLEINGVIVNC